MSRLVVGFLVVCTALVWQATPDDPSARVLATGALVVGVLPSVAVVLRDRRDRRRKVTRWR